MFDGKKIITFCHKNNIEADQNITGFYENSLEVLDELQDTQNNER